MRATARLVAEAGPDRRTRLVSVRSQAPLMLRRTGAAGPGVQVHLVGGAAGPLGGDRLRLEIEVGPGADLTVATVAASIALPGPARPVDLDPRADLGVVGPFEDRTAPTTPRSTGSPRSTVEVVASVAAGGRLAWLPEPLVAAAGCHHLATARVTLAEGAHLVWRDELVCGRYGESPGDVTVALAVTYGGRPLYHQELAVGPTSPGWDGPAVLAGARATGSLLLVEPAWLTGQPPPECHGPEAVTMPLAGPAVVTTAATADAATLRAHLNAVASASAAAKSAQPA